MSAAQFPLGVNIGIGLNTPTSTTREIFSKSLYTCVRLTRQESRPLHGTGSVVGATGGTMKVDDALPMRVTGATFVEADVVALVDVVVEAGGGGVVVDSFDVGVLDDGVGAEAAFVGAGVGEVVVFTAKAGHLIFLAPNCTANQTETETMVITIRALTTVDIFVSFYVSNLPFNFYSQSRFSSVKIHQFRCFEPPQNVDLTMHRAFCQKADGTSKGRASYVPANDLCLPI